MNIGHVLKLKDCEVTRVRPDDTVQTAARHIGSRKTGLAVVTDAAGRLLGVVSAMDIMRAVGEHGVDTPRMPVSALMTSEVVVCSSHDSVRQALEQMAARRIRHLPVVDNGIVEGVIKLRDAVEVRVGEVEVEADELRRYVYGLGFH
jgi:CBS domain-containing protein